MDNEVPGLNFEKGMNFSSSRFKNTILSVGYKINSAVRIVAYRHSYRAYTPGKKNKKRKWKIPHIDDFLVKVFDLIHSEVWGERKRIEIKKVYLLESIFPECYSHNITLTVVKYSQCSKYSINSSFVKLFFIFHHSFFTSKAYKAPHLQTCHQQNGTNEWKRETKENEIISIFIPANVPKF